MATTLNGVSLAVYGLTPAHAPSSNISLENCWSMPERLGDTYYSWAENDAVTPFVDAEDLIYAGRDLTLHASIFGTNAEIRGHLSDFYTAVRALTGLVTLSTPYGDFSVLVKSVTPELLNGGARVTIVFREPVVTLTGGTLPAVATSAYTFDGIPFASFGLYLSDAKELDALPEMKEQFFTSYATEGYQITKREANNLELNGFIIATSLANFQAKILALYKLFSSAGVRNVKLNDEVNIECFAKDGFQVSDVIVHSSGVISRFSIKLMVTKNLFNLYTLLSTYNNPILTSNNNNIII